MAIDVCAINEELKKFHIEMLSIKDDKKLVSRLATKIAKYLLSLKDSGIILFENNHNGSEMGILDIRKFILTFKDFDIQLCTATGNEKLFRRGYLDEKILGRWFGDKYRTIKEARDELAILEDWCSPLTGCYEVTLNEGTLFFKGPAKSQISKGSPPEYREGGGIQYYIQGFNLNKVKKCN